MIKLEIHKCQARASYIVIFEGELGSEEDRALAFLAKRTSTHAFHEIESAPIEPRYGRLIDFLYPTCEHGLSLSNCFGPQHYYYDEEEQARGMRNGF